MPEPRCGQRATTRGRPQWVFLDRDGTINIAPSPGTYVTDPSALRVLPGAAEAIARLNAAGTWVGVVTNQRGVALGVMSARDLDRVNDRLRALLAEEDAHLDAIYVCPHEIGSCDCRKPRTGMLEQARREVSGLDFTDAVIVGDSASDLEAGRGVGMRGVLIAPSDALTSGAELIVPSLAAAVDWILD